MKNPLRIIAISLLICALLATALPAGAAPAATVTHVSGPLMLRTVSGTTKTLSVGSTLEAGETVETAHRTYARLKFTDGSEVTLKPDTRFRVEAYAYDPANSKGDAGSFNLIKGGLRTITGQIGKRGNQDSYRMKTPTATIGIRGTIYDAHFCQGDGQKGEEESCGDLKPGLYLAVTDGSVVVSNDAGEKTTLQVKAGQYVYVQNPTTPPVVLPHKPPITFNPPPSVGSGSPRQPGQPQVQGGADCQVR